MTAVLERIPHNPDNPFPLGRNVEHDEQSRAFGFPVTAPTQDITVYWSSTKIISNQKKLGSCVGFTGLDVLNTDFFRPVRRRLHANKLYYNADGINFYHLATQNDEFDGVYPPVDEGSSGLGLAKALKNLGLIDRYTHTFSFSQFRAAIQTQPVAAGTLWTEDMFYPDSNGLVRVGNLSGSNIAGGHEFMIRGIDYEKRWVWCRNHWTRNWGKLGEFAIQLDEFGELLDQQGDVTVLHGVGLP